MGMTVTLTANDAAGTSYTLIGSGSPWALIAADWGNSAWDVQYSGPRGALGAVPVSSVPQNRTVGLQVRLLPASFDAATGHQRDVDNIVELMRRYGGTITRRHSNQTYRQHLTVFAGSAAAGAWTNRAEFAGRFDGALAFICAPYAEGDSMAVEDLFGSDTSGDYTFDEGAASNITITGGSVTPTSTSTLVAAVHTGVGYLYGDHCAEATFTPGSTTTDSLFGVILKRTSADNYLRVYADAATATHRIDKVVAGVATNLASTASSFSGIAPGDPIGIRAWIEGNRVRAIISQGFRDLDPFFSTVSRDTLDHTLSTTDAALFGANVTGQAGWIWTPRDLTAKLDNFRVRPYVYASSPASPTILELRGGIPGNAPAKVEAETSVYGVNAAFGMYAWGKRSLPRNMASQGDFVQWMPNVGRPWSVSAVSGVLANAGTSLGGGGSGGGYLGNGYLQVVCPATANSGATHTLTSRFRRGVTYTASLYVQSSSATTNFRIRLGVSGDISSSTASALSSTVWSQRTVTWTPTADVDQAYLVAEITAATATTFWLSDVMVYETAPTIPSQLNGAGGFPPLAILDAGEAHIDTNVSAGWTYTTGLGATYRNGTALRIATASVTRAECAWRIDPNLMDPDDHADSIDVEVWARVITPGTLGTSPRIIAFAGDNPGTGGSAVTTYTREYGSTGVTLTTSRTAFMRLGTLTLDRPTGGKQQWVGIQASMSTAGSGNLDIDYAVIVPARQRCLSPTGKSATSYPSYLNPPSLTNALVRTLPDLRNLKMDDARTRSPRSSPGFGGNTLEVGPGDVDVLVNHREDIPDRTDTNPADTTSITLQAVRFTPTPRWAQLRDE